MKVHSLHPHKRTGKIIVAFLDMKEEDERL
jgi:hypothetical protein